MGYWGTGNLESDYALDEIDTRSRKLVRSFLRRARRKTSRQWDEYDHTALLVDFETLFALHARALLSGAALPRPEELDRLEASFMKDYDAYATSQPRPAFRKVLISNFRRLRRICVKHATS
ncbi:MAG: hypothetical protein H6722_12125 [Sandaracinus sp.]|nr:hypothetical protein [Sandaracinus sp.]MCB9613192.1 hypothetical protein [Sandaracinus sp.]